MAVFKCKMCEANLEVSGNTTVIKCEYCGTTQTVPWAEGGASGNAAAFGGNLENLIKRGNLSLEDRKWDDAEKYFDRVLDINVEESRAYIGKLLAENHVLTLDELWESKAWNSIKAMDNYKKAYRFADDNMKKMLDEYYIKWVYRAACAKAGSQRMSDVEEAIHLFNSIAYYEDSEEQAEKCRRKIYDHAVRLMEMAYSEKEYLTAKSEFDSISDYWDANVKAQECAFKAGEIVEEEKRRSERRKQEQREQMIQAAIQNEQHFKKMKFIVEVSILFTVILYFLLRFWLLPVGRYNKAMKLYENESYDKAIALFTKVDDYKDSYNMIAASYFAKGMALYESGDHDGAISAFRAAGGYSDSEEMIKASCYGKAMEFYEVEDYDNALLYFRDANGYSDSESMIEKIYVIMNEKYYSIIEALPIGVIDARDYAVAITKDSRVLYDGDNKYVRNIVSKWLPIAKVSAGYNNVAGLKPNGTVVAAGNNEYHQCDEVSNWSDIVDISCGSMHIAGLLSDGTVVASGNNDSGQCDVSDWTDIIDISAGNEHTVGLRADGTVVAAGNNEYGQCDVSDWTNIVAVSAGTYHTVGLRSDGTVVAVGNNLNRQCNLRYWTDVIAISAGDDRTAALRSDGTVIVGGGSYINETYEWTDIVAVAAGDDYVLGVKSDGTVVETWHYNRSPKHWTNIKTTP